MKSHIQFAKWLVAFMDTKFTLFGIRFGIDPFLDALPWLGSFIGAVISCYLLWIAYELRVPRWMYVRMAWHIVLDFVMGALPFVGFFFDLFYHANTKNLALLEPFIDPEILEGKLVEP